MTNFEMIKQMRESIIYEGMGFQEFFDNQATDFSRTKMKRLWRKACEVSGKDEWERFLCNKVTTALGQFSHAINELYEEGICETDISSRFSIDIRTVTSILNG